MSFDRFRIETCHLCSAFDVAKSQSPKLGPRNALFSCFTMEWNIFWRSFVSFSWICVFTRYFSLPWSGLINSELQIFLIGPKIALMMKKIIWIWIWKNLSDCTPARTLSISWLKSRVLKLSFFSLKMIVKSGLEFFLNSPSPFRDTC